MNLPTIYQLLGVGRNIAEVLGRLGAEPVLYSAIGTDARGKALMDTLTECGVLYETGLSMAVVKDVSTSTYLAVLDTQGDLYTAIADMKALKHIPVPSQKTLEKAQFLVIDANPPLQKMIEAAQLAARIGVCVFFEPTSVFKAHAAFQSDDFVSCLSIASPNAEELLAMAMYRNQSSIDLKQLRSHNANFLQEAATRVLTRMAPNSCLIITLGENGVSWFKV